MNTAQVKTWFQDPLVVQSQTGSDAMTGKPQFGTQRTILGKVDQVLRREQTLSGTVVKTVSVFVTNQPILSGDMFWPAGADPTDPNQSRRLGEVRKEHNKQAFTLYEVDL